MAVCFLSIFTTLMKISTYQLFALTAFFLFSCSDDNSSAPAPPTIPDNAQGSGNNDVLVWSEEFDYEGLPDSDTWVIETGNGDWGWGNGESQYYLEDNINVSNGTLKIHVKKENQSGFQYTSARLKTQYGYSFKYGRVDVRAKLPSNQGTWPAIWMLGNSHSSIGWPRCGEVDIMEQTGANKNKILATAHWHNGNGTSSYPNRSNASSENIQAGEIAIQNASTQFHTYSIDWTDTRIKMLLDDVEYFSMPTNSTQPFDKKFFFLLNVAVGGTLGGDIPFNFPDDVMEIDYIRVYQ